MPEERKRIAMDAAKGGGQIDGNAVRNLVVKTHRQHLLRSKEACIEMDELSFKAHMKNVRGWPKKRIKSKWVEIEAEPGRFRTSMLKGELNVWVPQKKEVALEELVVIDTSGEGRTLTLDKEKADQVLLGSKVSHNALRSVGASMVGGSISHGPVWYQNGARETFWELTT